MDNEQPADTGKIIRNNLIALLLGGVLAASLARFSGGTSVVLFGIGFIGQVGVNGLIGLVNAIQGRPALGYFLSAALVGLIGFGACAGMLTLSGANF